MTLKDDVACLTIEDNGIGLPEDITTDGDTGFGLNLVKMLIEQMRGNMVIERGAGTKFIMTFKINKANPN